ncbi:hydantoinase/carbamoylase family amidase [Bacillus aerolatus]|uniref:Hydantoinase/carbamoylase family amidase n=1 Tax=Bacillus aerolatus TaxID=2653354 RepID=A0A6I1FFH3_9BACI|nr:Zn-dependent hydrolase [Bacillus aerolatus]KAB7706716.1 hydantoinase/carbamoylase family amidase [Bacillus aerolatus]
MDISLKERLLNTLPNCHSYAGLDPAKLADRLDALAAIGRTEAGGISRFVYTKEEKEAKELFKSWLQEIGLVVREDPLGNIFARYEGTEPSLPVVMTGSHLDTVPNGGAFDGVLGCVSSFMAIEALVKEGRKPKRSIELVVFIDEEGTRFQNGIFGSRVMMGEVLYDDLLSLQDKDGVKFVQAAREIGLQPENIEDAYYPKEDICAFLELHIEQGKQLEISNDNIGVVNGIAGTSWHTYTFYGETDHAGNTPMNLRKDSVAAAAEFIVEVEKIPPTISETAVATVGKIDVLPNGANVIAGEATVTVDARDIDEDQRDRMIELITETAKTIAKNRELKIKHESEFRIPPVKVPEPIQQAVRESADSLQLSHRPIPSGAGHDAMVLGKYVPAGMIFVPSVNGKSHSPEEFTNLNDCLDGIAVLKETLFKLSNQSTLDSKSPKSVKVES